MVLSSKEGWNARVWRPSLPQRTSGRVPHARRGETRDRRERATTRSAARESQKVRDDSPGNRDEQDGRGMCGNGEESSPNRGTMARSGPANQPHDTDDGDMVTAIAAVGGATPSAFRRFQTSKFRSLFSLPAVFR